LFSKKWLNILIRLKVPLASGTSIHILGRMANQASAFALTSKQTKSSQCAIWSLRTTGSGNRCVIHSFSICNIHDCAIVVKWNWVYKNIPLQYSAQFSLTQA
jgi:hypothetical protein